MKTSSGIILCILGLLVSLADSSVQTFSDQPDQYLDALRNDAVKYSFYADELARSLQNDIPGFTSKYRLVAPALERIVARLRELVMPTVCYSRDLKLCIKMSDEYIWQFKAVLGQMSQIAELPNIVSLKTRKAVSTLRYAVIRTEGTILEAEWWIRFQSIRAHGGRLMYLIEEKGEKEGLALVLKHGWDLPYSNLKKAFGILGIESIILSQDSADIPQEDEMTAIWSILKETPRSFDNANIARERLNTVRTELAKLHHLLNGSFARGREEVGPGSVLSNKYLAIARESSTN